MKCSLCDYCSVKKYNIDRHFQSKHGCENQTSSNSSAAANVDVLTANVDVLACNVDEQTSTNSEQSEQCFGCSVCEKSFTRRFNFINHKCKGVKNSLECPYCHNVYSSRSSKSHHMKVCVAKFVSESKDHQQQLQNITNIDNQTINNNIHNDNSIQKQQNNNITINVVQFPDGNSTPIPFNYDAVNDINIIRKLFGNCNLFQGVCNYAQAVIKQPGNNCIRKTNPRASYSMVHSGNDKWTIKYDKDVYPKLTSDISSNLLEYLEVSDKKLRFQENLEDVLNNVVSQQTPDFKQVMQRITLMVVELSRNTVELMLDAQKQSIK